MECIFMQERVYNLYKTFDNKRLNILNELIKI